MHLPASPPKNIGAQKKALFREVCYRCFRPRSACFCGDIEALHTRTRFVILMHPKEARKVKLGTGRLTHICLKNSEILQGVNFTEDRKINSMIKNPDYYPVILYPGEKSVDISEFHFPPEIRDKKRILVFVIDASWTLAKKMLKMSANLSALPKIRFKPLEPSRYVIKQQPHEFCRSTIESVYFLLQELDRRGIEKCRGKHRLLLEYLDRICRLQEDCTKDPSLPGYRRNAVNSSSKKKSLDNSRVPGKRQKRSICFD